MTIHKRIRRLKEFTDTVGLSTGEQKRLCNALEIAVKAMEKRRVECGFVGETLTQIEEVLK